MSFCFTDEAQDILKNGSPEFQVYRAVDEIHGCVKKEIVEKVGIAIFSKGFPIAFNGKMLHFNIADCRITRLPLNGKTDLIQLYLKETMENKISHLELLKKKGLIHEINAKL